jgi:hypothetical protein
MEFIVQSVMRNVFHIVSVNDNAVFDWLFAEENAGFDLKQISRLLDDQE